MSSGRNRAAERRAEQAFAIQQQAIAQQQKFLASQSAQSQAVVDLLNQAAAGNQQAQVQATSELNRAVAGRPNPALDAFIKDLETTGAETIRKQFGQGGQTGTGALATRKNIDLTKLQAIEQVRQGDINTALALRTGATDIESTRVGQLLQAANNPLQGSQVLGQSATQFGQLNQFTPQSNNLQNLGVAAISGLAQPNAFSNIGSNLSSLNTFLRGSGIPYVPGI